MILILNKKDVFPRSVKEEKLIKSNNDEEIYEGKLVLIPKA